MTALHRVALADVPPQPWRNGSGTTHELLAWSPGHGAGTVADWTLRVSVATIAADGPFSVFGGIRRWFAVVAGHGVVLSAPTAGPGAPEFERAAGTETVCTRDSDPHAFDGAEAPHCRLLDGPTRDLNLMLRDGSGRGAMTRVATTPTMAEGRRWRGLFCAEAATLTAAGTRHRLPAMTLAWADRPDDDWFCEPAVAWWLTLDEEAR